MIYRLAEYFRLLARATVILLLLLPTLAANAGPTGRSQWVWGDVFDLLNNPTRRDHVLNLWESQGIDTGYLWIDSSTITSSPESYRSLIRDIHARGMKAYALDGDPSFVLPGASHSLALARFQNVLDFNTAGVVDERFDGAHFDNEPWALTQWNANMALTIQQYLTLSSEYVQLRDASGSSMTIASDVAFILAATSISEIANTTWEDETKPLYKHVQDIYDSVTLLDYRDFALGIDSIDFHAQPWLDYGDLIGKPVEIGVETGGPLIPEKVTFYDEGIAFMETELALAEAQFLSRPSYDGIAVHFLDAFETLLLSEALPGDVNLDGTVDGIDLSQFERNYGNSSQFWTQGDLNEDSVVDGSDFLIWQRGYGNSSVATLEGMNIPEPTSILLCILASPAVMLWRW